MTSHTQVSHDLRILLGIKMPTGATQLAQFTLEIMTKRTNIIVTKNIEIKELFVHGLFSFNL